MILDELGEFADATSVAAVASTALIGDVIDLGGVTQDIGIGEDMWFVITTDTEIITAGAAGTIEFFLVSDALATLGAGVVANCTLHFRTGTFVTDDAGANSDFLNAGGVICAVRLPAGTYERFLGVLATIATTEVTAGKINAFLTKDFAKWVAQPDASN